MHLASSLRAKGSTPMAGEFPDWFSAYAKPNFEKYLIPLAGVDNLHFLQLGAYTGDASVWMLENIKPLMLTDVDTWEGSDEEVHKKMNFSKVEIAYDEKVKGRTNKEKCTTFDYLFKYSIPGFIEYEFIYVDADHTAASVLLDAELSWPLLKSGGLLAFDDYQWGQHLPASKSPKLGIDLFLERHAGEYEILEQGLQVWIRKL
jgi:predicted O-methyltransferase YrrM